MSFVGMDRIRTLSAAGSAEETDDVTCTAAARASNVSAVRPINTGLLEVDFIKWRFGSFDRQGEDGDEKREYLSFAEWGQVGA